MAVENYLIGINILDELNIQTLKCKEIKINILLNIIILFNKQYDKEKVEEFIKKALKESNNTVSKYKMAHILSVSFVLLSIEKDEKLINERYKLFGSTTFLVGKYLIRHERTE